MKIVLASASERRIELLKRLTENFSVIVSGFDEESVSFEGDFEDYVISLSKGKALSTSKKINEGALILACDTVVAYQNKLLEKPKSKEEAIDMLKILSGNRHKVYSGITVLDTESGKSISDYAVTEVVFSKLDDNEILKYVDTGEPMDKAGSYGIQGIGGTFVEEIHGCFYNVVGLPLNKLKKMLRGMGANL
ncbi:Maf-like protein [Clostridium sp. 19966]|uniref:Maf-like protein n=1 Tax=Clostridium sp. 19966 TaxID=2768166 RepID=UPI0028DD9383|nr:Maf-like protein [Clostridium sp. 19966]MDT8715268.1 Maf-like protein [Clostridium sp. 19966]